MLLDAGSDHELLEIIKHLKTKGTSAFRQFQRQAEIRRSRYYGEHYPETGRGQRAEPGEERVILNHEMRLVDKAHGLLTLDSPKISLSPEDETSQGLIESDKAEAWLEGVLYMQRLRQGQDPISLSVFDALVTSMGAWRVYWDPNLDSRETTGEQGILEELPIVIKRLDPTKLLLQEGGRKERYQWYMYVDKIPIADIEAEWPDAAPLKGVKVTKAHQKLTKTETIIDLWAWEDDKIVNTVVTPHQVLKEPVAISQYEYLPIVTWFCRPTPSAQWEYKGLPITASIEKTTPELEATMNSYIRMVTLLSQLPLVHEGPSDAPLVPSGFGNVIHLGEGEKLGFLTWPGAAPDVHRVLSMLQAEVDAGTLGAPLSGEIGTSASGYALALRGQAGTLNLVAPQQSLSLAMTELLTKVCSLAANFAPDLEMRVFGKHENQRKVFALTGQQMQGWFIDVEVSAQFPEDKDRKMAWGLQMSALGPQAPLDQRTIVEEFMGFENAQLIKDRKLVDLAEQHPGVQMTQVVMALQKLGLDFLIPIITGQQGEQPQGPPQQGGSPPRISPNMPVEGVPTTIKPQEEMGAMRSQELGMAPENLTDLIQRNM